MNKQQAQTFIKNLYQQVWDELNQDKIADFYHQDVVGFIGEQQAGFADIINRNQYTAKRFKRLQNTIEDVLCDGDKITVRLKQACLNENDQVQKNYHGIVIYQLRDNKVATMWAAFNEYIDYFEKA